MKNIIVIDNKPYSVNTIRELVGDYNITVYEAKNSFEVFSTLQKLNNNAELIITDVNLGKESGIDIIKKIKEKGIKCPIIILTSENKKKTFIEGIKAGATDYILRPFEGKFLLKRIVKDIEKNNKDSKIVKKSSKPIVDNKKKEESVDFNKYLSEKIYNSKKNLNGFSMVMITIFKTVDEFTHEVEKEYNVLTKKIYPKLKELFLDAEIFTKYGQQSFVGVFKELKPMKEQELTNKIKKIFNDEKKLSKTHDKYFLECAFAKYPREGQNKNELLEKVQDKIVEKINVIKRMEKQ
ncbi:chemotaxis protein [Clostridium novyi A str. 4570]|uniref:Stage 0 sporulation protein A homolog n=1 Tax=Clostridium novyi A str. 4570 TaxID=1444290 RepID=A0AA89CT74_CLONO|nr:response regulator [Clostridium novyi]KGN03150.1 chemotaxis protein [Clostridium novyi A str. 4570]